MFSNIEEQDGTGVGIYLNNSLSAREIIFNCNDHSIEYTVGTHPANLFLKTINDCYLT